MWNVVGEDGGGRGIVADWMTGSELMRDIALLTPHKHAAFRALSREGVKGGLMRATIEKLRMRFFFWTANGDRMASDDLCDS